MVKSNCPKCRHEVEVTPPVEIGKQLICPKCLAQLEVIWLYPLFIDLAEERSENILGTALGQTPSQ